MARLWTLWLVLGIGSSCFGARILSIVPMPSRSHGILMERLLRELVGKGHSVTNIASTPPSKPVPNLEVIYVPGVRDAMMNSFGAFKSSNESSLLTFRKTNALLPLLFGHKVSLAMCEHILAHPDVKSLIESDKHFDLILGEIMLDESLLAGFSHRFKAPIVAFSPTMPSYFANYLVGNPAPSSFIPDVFIGYGSKMSFWERVHNFLHTLAMELNHSLRYLPYHDELMKKYFGADAPDISDVLKNTSLVLVNHHFALSFPRPYLPNMIEVAGVHINEPKSLPRELASYMDNSPNGVVLFSLGTNVNSSDLPPQKIDAILKGLSRLKENVLWKFEAQLENVPENVRIMKWLPQSDVLAHPNLKAFITHGGLLSTTEAMFYGIPVVGIPLMGDQRINMKQVEDAGWGVILDLDDIDESTIYEAITTVINDSNYKKEAARRSVILKDNPLSSLESSIWWIEYVLRHDGAHFLRSAAQDLAWYQLYMIDVYAIVAIFVIAVTWMNVCFFKCILRRCTKSLSGKKIKIN